MEYRGITLLVFGASLIMSPLAIRLATGDIKPHAIASYVQTEAGANSTCADVAVLDIDNSGGCRPQTGLLRTGNAATRRVMEGGAVFLSARR